MATPEHERREDGASAGSAAWSFLVARVVALSELAAVVLGVLTAIAFFAPWNAFADIVVNFRHIFALLAVVPLGVLIWRRRPILGALAAAGFVANLVFVADALPYRSPSCEPDITIAAYNALGPDVDVDRATAMLAEQSVDVVVVSELGVAFDERLRSTYPHHFSSANDGTVGMGVFSRFPLRNSRRESGAWFPQIWTTVLTEAGEVEVVGLHPPPPFQSGTSALRNQEIRDVAAAVGRISGPVVVAGDLNVSRQSPHFRPLLEAGLVDSRVGRGIHGTWPAPTPLRVAIDHVLPSGEHFDVCDFRSAEASGSDHRPIIVGLAMR